MGTQTGIDGFKPVFLTNNIARKLPTPNKGQRVVRDAGPNGVRGFMLVIGQRARTYAYQCDVRTVNGTKTVRKSIGRIDDISASAAREIAKDAIGGLRIGRLKPKDEGPTLQQAWALYEAALRKRNRSPRTVYGYRDSVERLLRPWLDTPLARLADDPIGVAERHEFLTKNNGAYAANRAMDALRAIYRHTRKFHRTLPHHEPTSVVIRNEEQRRDNGMSLTQLPDWFEKLDELINPVRREFHLFSLLSGMRPGALREARWCDLHVAERRLHVPRPKGGEKRKFDLPLSRALLACLARARRAGRLLHPDQSEEWIFPANSATGHISEYKEDGLKVGGDLRQSYMTIAKELGIDWYYVKLMVNHKVGNDVTSGYVSAPALFGELRKAQEQISRAILARYDN